MSEQIERSQQFHLPGMADTRVTEECIGSVHTLTSDDVERLRSKKPKTLGIRCNRSECEQDLHCFLPSGKDSSYIPGPCRACGVDLIDWDKMSIRDLRDVQEKFKILKVEWIRHFFFHVPITPRIEAYARKNGLNGLAAAAQRQLSQGKMIRFNSDWDFSQTKMLDGTIVHWARHAVACCCRKCMAYWHNVPVTTDLCASDIDYFRQLIVLYIKERIPDLLDHPQSQPPRKSVNNVLRKAS